MSRNKESRAEREARWAAETKVWQESGLAGGNMVEVGAMRRGLRGRYAYDIRLNADTSPHWVWRESEDEEPEHVRLFALIPAAEVGGGKTDAHE